MAQARGSCVKLDLELSVNSDPSITENTVYKKSGANIFFEPEFLKRDLSGNPKVDEPCNMEIQPLLSPTEKRLLEILKKYPEETKLEMIEKLDLLEKLKKE